jgi:hypothetical protein
MSSLGGIANAATLEAEKHDQLAINSKAVRKLTPTPPSHLPSGDTGPATPIKTQKSETESVLSLLAG